MPKVTPSNVGACIYAQSDSLLCPKWPSFDPEWFMPKVTQNSCPKWPPCRFKDQYRNSLVKECLNKGIVQYRNSSLQVIGNDLQSKWLQIQRSNIYVTCMFCSYSFRNLDKDAKMPVPFIMLDGISQFQIRSERKVCKSVSEKSDTRSDSAIASFDE